MNQSLKKIITIGDSSVGKSSLLNLYKNNTVNPNIIPTIALDFLTINLKVNSQDMKLILYDTAGQERYRNFSHQWFKNSSGVLLVFSVTDRTSFKNIERWVDSLVQNASDFVLFLIGNKIDLQDERVVSHEEAENLAQKLQVRYIETSIYVNKMPENGVNIHEIIYDLASQIQKKQQINTGDNELARDSFSLNKQTKVEAPSRCRC